MFSPETLLSLFNQEAKFQSVQAAKETQGRKLKCLSWGENRSHLNVSDIP
jgi:hypothetical protein